MNIRSLIIGSILLLSTSAFAGQAEEKGLELARKTREVRKGFRSEYGSMELILINAHGDRITRKIVGKTIEVKNDGDKEILTFLWPADVKGTKLLTWSHRKESDDQWLYMPALKRVKRINSSGKTGSFMGSEFSYEDLGSQEVEDFTYKYIKTIKIKNNKVAVIERYPVGEDSGYKRSVLWLDMVYWGARKIEYYDRKNELLKTATMSRFKKIKKWWRFFEIKMINHQTKKKSIIKWKKRKLGTKIKESEFHKSKLK